MDIPEERQTNHSENNQPEQREATKPPRYADWISYATAVTQQAPATSQNTR